jgi:hypothetical protein
MPEPRAKPGCDHPRDVQAPRAPGRHPAPGQAPRARLGTQRDGVRSGDSVTAGLPTADGAAGLDSFGRLILL